MIEDVDLLHQGLEGDGLAADPDVRQLVMLAQRVVQSLAEQTLTDEQRARIRSTAYGMARRRLATLHLGSVRTRTLVGGAAAVTVAAVGIGVVVRGRRQHASAIA